jgi:hypothetical protein
MVTGVPVAMLKLISSGPSKVGTSHISAASADEVGFSVLVWAAKPLMHLVGSTPRHLFLILLG